MICDKALENLFMHQLAIHLDVHVTLMESQITHKKKRGWPSFHIIYGGVRPPLPPRHDTMAPEEPTPARVQPPRQAKTKDADFHYTK